MKIDVILVPVDFSDDSEAALEYALDLAKRFGARVLLLHAFPSGIPATAYWDAVLPPDIMPQVREAATRKLATWAARAGEQGVQVEEHLSPLPVTDAIKGLAEESQVDLIVMGTRGLTGMKHVLLGSVAERTVRVAPCPVLIVKPAA